MVCRMLDVGRMLEIGWMESLYVDPNLSQVEHKRALRSHLEIKSNT